MYCSVFGFAEYIGNLIETPNIISKHIKELVKQACSIPKWAQHRKQLMIDQNTDVDYSKISEEIIGKCAIILHSEYHIAFTELGYMKLQNFILPLFRESASEVSVVE